MNFPHIFHSHLLQGFAGELGFNVKEDASQVEDYIFYGTGFGHRFFVAADAMERYKKRISVVLTSSASGMVNLNFRFRNREFG